jgi:hypothetical protein
LRASSSSPYATVLVPTHIHKETLGWVIRAIQDQTFEDFELFIVGDGAPAAVREVALQIAQTDDRIKYFDFPKGMGRGEINRKSALEKGQGQIVCYCADDDLWFRNHLSSMVALLKDVDFGHSQVVEVDEFGRIHGHGGGIECLKYREIMLQTWHLNLGLTTIGHTMDAYRRLPGGWQPAPPGVASDLNMIRRFFCVPGLRFGSLLEPSTIRFGNWAGMQRFEEQEEPSPDAASGPSIEEWWARTRDPDFEPSFQKRVMESAARRVGFGIHAERRRQAAVRLLAEREQAIEQLTAKLAEAESQLSKLQAQVTAAES